MSQDLRKLAKKASSIENTKELADYWYKKYLDLLQNHYFIVKQKTQTISNLSQVSKPFTPEASVVLSGHLRDGSINEGKLKITLEILVRFLDSLLDVINFDKKTLKTIQKHRKISIGIADFQDYKNQNKGGDDAVKYIGELVSKSLYRATEYLAEEKGAFKEWNQYKAKLQPSEFIYWYNSDSGKIENGLKIFNNFSQKEITNSDFEVIPRRNSNLIEPPVSQKWVNYSDRDPLTIFPPKDIYKAEDVKFAQEEVKPKALKAVQKIIKKTPPKPKYSLGELTIVKDSTSKYFNKTMQICGVNNLHQEVIYTLQDADKKLKITEKYLEMVNLKDILEKINEPRKEIKINEPRNLHHPSTDKNQNQINTYLKKLQNNLFNLMSKYTLKLEQTIQSKKYGEVVVELSYTSKGLNKINLLNSNIEKDFSQPTLGLINLLIASNIPNNKITEVLQVNSNSDFNELLSQVAETIAEAPVQIQGITPEFLSQDSNNQLPSNQDEEVIQIVKEKVIQQEDDVIQVTDEAISKVEDVEQETNQEEKMNQEYQEPETFQINSVIEEALASEIPGGEKKVSKKSKFGFNPFS